MPGRTPPTPSSVTRTGELSPAVAAPAAANVDASTRSVLTDEIVGGRASVASARAEPALLHPLGALGGAALYVAALSAYMWREGIPVGRERLLLIIVLGLLALSTTNLRGSADRSVVLEWLPLALVLAAYDLLRGHADTLFFSAWYRPQLEADAFLSGGTVPMVRLQDHLWHGSSDLRWYDYASWAVYVSYFVVTYLVAGLLWFFARERFRRYVGCVALLAGMAFTTFALFPAAPPWLASREGELEWTTRLIGPISGHIPFFSFSFEGYCGSAAPNTRTPLPRCRRCTLPTRCW